ncbi:MAG TPA: hypothetical protein VI756_20210 [Blastocatellia bacterium]
MPVINPVARDHADSHLKEVYDQLEDQRRRRIDKGQVPVQVRIRSQWQLDHQDDGKMGNERRKV